MRFDVLPRHVNLFVPASDASIAESQQSNLSRFMAHIPLAHSLGDDRNIASDRHPMLERLLDDAFSIITKKNLFTKIIQ